MKPFAERRRRPMFSRTPNFGLRAFLLIAAGSGLLLVGSREGYLDTTRDWIAKGLQPLIWTINLPQVIDGMLDRFADRERLEGEIHQLRDAQLVLDVRLQKTAALEAENQRLRELLSSAAAIHQRVLIAGILSVSQDPYRHQIMLDKGYSDGVYRGQALVDAYGVLGQIIEVSPSTSVALLIIDPNHGIPVEVNRTGLLTIALGRGDGLGLSLPYLPGNADIRVGDLLVSSGLGGRFPAGYPVGEIHELRHAAGESFMEAIAFPSAHLNQGNRALLVWSDEASKTAAAGAAPATQPASASSSAGIAVKASKPATKSLRHRP